MKYPERFEVIFIDDGSTDGTFAAMRALNEQDPRVKVIRFRRNYGKTAALVAGFERCAGEVGATETSLGLVPEYAHLDWSGLEFDARRFSRIMGVDRDEWEVELVSHDALFQRLGDKRPDRLLKERDRLAGRIGM